MLCFCEISQITLTVDTVAAEVAILKALDRIIQMKLEACQRLLHQSDEVGSKSN